LDNKNNHIMSYRFLGLVLTALLILTSVTVAASMVDLGWLNVWVALVIASIKGSLVLMFFMHLKYEGRVMVISFLGTIFFLAIMISLTFLDVAFR
jgi:cytochrome c oxidase subunit 4